MQEQDLRNQVLARSLLESAANNSSLPNLLQQQAINLMRGLTRERNNALI